MKHVGVEVEAADRGKSGGCRPRCTRERHRPVRRSGHGLRTVGRAARGGSASSNDGGGGRGGGGAVGGRVAGVGRACCVGSAGCVAGGSRRAGGARGGRGRDRGRRGGSGRPGGGAGSVGSDRGCVSRGFGGEGGVLLRRSSRRLGSRCAWSRFPRWSRRGDAGAGRGRSARVLSGSSAWGSAVLVERDDRGAGGRDATVPASLGRPGSSVRLRRGQDRAGGQDHSGAVNRDGRVDRHAGVEPRDGEPLLGLGRPSLPSRRGREGRVATPAPGAARSQAQHPVRLSGLARGLRRGEHEGLPGAGLRGHAVLPARLLLLEDGVAVRRPPVPARRLDQRPDLRAGAGHQPGLEVGLRSQRHRALQQVRRPHGRQLRPLRHGADRAR